MKRYNVWGLETAPNEQGRYVMYDDVQAVVEALKEIAKGLNANHPLYKQYLADDDWWANRRNRLTDNFAAWFAQHALSQGEEDHGNNLQQP